MNKHLKELDSLRGIAVILVMAIHIFKRADYFTKHEVLHFVTNLTSIGWMGVDIFFTLSGFLITGILLRTKNEQSFFKLFYARRVLRIFPLYYVFLIVILLLIPFIASEYAPHVPGALPFLILYLQNWMGPLGLPQLPTHLNVTWSLAIEEQFYLIWPAIVYYTRRETLMKVSIGFILLSFLVRLLGIMLWTDVEKMAGFFYINTFTRFEELVIGGLLALSLTHPAWKERIRSLSLPVFILSFFTFMILCISLFPGLLPYYSNIPLTLWSYTLIPLFSAALIAIFMTHPENSQIRRAFQGRILAFFGKHSYALYLLHLPIALTLLDPLYNTRLRGWKMYLAYIVLSYGLTLLASVLTWHVLEKPMLNLKRYFEYNRTGADQAANKDFGD